MRLPHLACVCLAALLSGLAHAEPAFTDRTGDLGLSFGNDAACWVDVNNDGWVDLCAGGAVWRNDGGQGFTRLAEGVGCVVAADYDNDGYADLFSWSSLRVLHNDAGAGFTPIEMPELPPCGSRGACWGDFNGDGFVDLYVGGYEIWDTQTTFPDLILMNEAGQGFKLAWSETRYRARGVTACDFDRDGDLDVYVSNYRLQPNLLWRNDGSGVFEDAAAALNAVATSEGFEGGHSIGAAWGDFDADGEIDLFAGNFAHVDNRGDQPKSRFLRNRGAEGGYAFEDLGTCGVFYQESYSNPAASDYDNDGDLDLYFTTVYATASFGRKNYPVLFRNDGAFTFDDATSAAGVAEQPPTSQAAWADFDNDGDLDLATAGRLFVNGGAPGHWLKVRLEGDGKGVNRCAIGAQVRVVLADRTLTRQVEAGTGEGNQNDLTLHFGLGEQAGPVRLEIAWPDGVTRKVRGVKVDRLLTVRYRR